MIWRILWPLLLAAFLGLVSANFFLGLPGALLIDLFAPEAAIAKLGPGAMAYAVIVSFLAPFGVALALWAMMAWRPQSAWWQWMGASLAGYLAAGGIAALNVV